MYKIFYVKDSVEIAEILRLGKEKNIKIYTEKIDAYNACKLGDLHEISSGAEEPYVFNENEYIGDIYSLKNILNN